MGAWTTTGCGLENTGDVWGSKGRVPETQGFRVSSFGDPLRQVFWPSVPGQLSREPDSGLRPELAGGLWGCAQ